jgi:UTP--glucose-1-phosphate uridylyltransferase
MIEKAVIPAAGFGTRFLPATKAQPNEMLPVVDKPVIQLYCRRSAIVWHKGYFDYHRPRQAAIEDYFDKGTIDNRGLN